jgi:hypothetical protein
MLSIRVAAVTFFGAFTLWSQTPQTDRGREYPEASAAIAAEASPAEIEQSAPAALPPVSGFSFKLDGSHFPAPDTGEFKLAALSTPLGTADSAQSTSKPKAVSLSKGFFYQAENP